MHNNPIAEASSNDEYRFDQNTVRMGLGATILGFLLFGSLGIVSGLQEGFKSKGLLIALIACLGLIATAMHIARLSGRSLRITDDATNTETRSVDFTGLNWPESLNAAGWLNWLSGTNLGHVEC